MADVVKFGDVLLGKAVRGDVVIGAFCFFDERLV